MHAVCREGGPRAATLAPGSGTVTRSAGPAHTLRPFAAGVDCTGLARVARGCRLVKPETILAWHRGGFPALLDVGKPPPGSTGRPTRPPTVDSRDGGGKSAVGRGTSKERPLSGLNLLTHASG